MDEENFRRFMKKQRRSEGTIDSCIGLVKKFEEYLSEHNGGKELDKADPRDIEDFVSWGKKRFGSVNSYLWAIHRYYEFTSNEDMRRVAVELRRREIEKGRSKREPLSLKKIQGISLEHVKRLASFGIENSKHMLEIGRTREGRKGLSEKTGIPLERILEFVKFADITRISDIKGVKGRLLYESNVDTIEKLSKFSPEDLRSVLKKVNERKKILRNPPTLTETTYWTHQAKKLPRIVEY